MQSSEGLLDVGSSVHWFFVPAHAGSVAHAQVQHPCVSLAHLKVGFAPAPVFTHISPLPHVSVPHDALAHQASGIGKASIVCHLPLEQCRLLQNWHSSVQAEGWQKAPSTEHDVPCVVDVEQLGSDDFFPPSLAASAVVVEPSVMDVCASLWREDPSSAPPSAVPTALVVPPQAATSAKQGPRRKGMVRMVAPQSNVRALRACESFHALRVQERVPS